MKLRLENAKPELEEGQEMFIVQFRTVMTKEGFQNMLACTDGLELDVEVGLK